MIYFFLRYILFVFLWLLLRPKLYGKNNLKIKGKAIFVCNHISMWDPVVLALVSPRNIHFMAKKELFQSLPSRLFFQACLAFPVNRKNADIESLRSALRVLNKGKVFGIFPEGKRAVTNDLDEFERGAAFLAIRSGAPLIPLYIRPDGYQRLRTEVIAGEPIDISDIIANSKKSDLVEIVTDEIADKIDALRLEMEAMH